MGTSGLPPEALPEPAWQTGNQFQLGRGPSTLEEMFPQRQIGSGPSTFGLPIPTGNTPILMEPPKLLRPLGNESWSRLATEMQYPPKPYATLVPKPIGKYKAQNPNLIAEYMKQLQKVK
jgi:hypothetical protein